MRNKKPYWSTAIFKSGGTMTKKKTRPAIYEGTLYPSGLSYSHRADSFFKTLVQKYKQDDNEVHKPKSLNSKGKKGRKELGFESS